MDRQRPDGSGPSHHMLRFPSGTTPDEGEKRVKPAYIGRRAFFISAVSMLAFAVSRSAPSPSNGLDIDAFIKGAFLTYETDFTMPTSPERFGRMLDDLFIMGALWEAYGFSPRYKVVRMGTVWHVVDPTGLEGNLRTVEASSHHRTLIANGRLKNWFIPKTISGRALFFLRYTPAP